MIKRILGGAAAAAFAATLLASGPASAHTTKVCSPHANPTGGTAVGPTNVILPSGTSGSVGTYGSNGWIVASGDASKQSGSIAGHHSTAAVDGRIGSGGKGGGPAVCVNGTQYN
ncbi:MAG: hypothetical protein ACT4OV_02210 [Microthrixaceae bacterium]